MIARQQHVVVSSYSYDNADRLTEIDHVKGGSTAIASVAYTLDDVGNRTQRVDEQGTHTYAYDDLYRLTSVTYPGPTTTSYTFDAFGNRTSMTGASGTTNYAYDVYGKPTPTGTLPNEFDFAAQQTDPTGLQYLRDHYRNFRPWQ